MRCALAEAGAAIAICDLLAEEGESTRAELSALGREAFFSRVDVTASGEIDSFIDEVMRRYGRIDILVNNASMPSEGCPLEDVADELWRKIIDTNLSSMFYVGKRVAERMREARQGEHHQHRLHQLLRHQQHLPAPQRHLLRRKGGGGALDARVDNI